MPRFSFRAGRKSPILSAGSKSRLQPLAAAEDKLAKKAARLAEANKPPPKVAVTLPPDAKDVHQTKDQIKFTVGKGKAQGSSKRGAFSSAKPAGKKMLPQ